MSFSCCKGNFSKETFDLFRKTSRNVFVVCLCYPFVLILTWKNVKNLLLKPRTSSLRRNVLLYASLPESKCNINSDWYFNQSQLSCAKCNSNYRATLQLVEFRIRFLSYASMLEPKGEVPGLKKEWENPEIVQVKTYFSWPELPFTHNLRWPWFSTSVLLLGCWPI